MKRIYLDNSATTPVDKRVEKAMCSSLRKGFGNPSSIHSEGVMARKEVEEARRKTARFFGVLSDEIIFTGSGTESNNLAIFGVFENLLIDRTSTSINEQAIESATLHTDARRPYEGLHAVTSVIEHPSVLETFRVLEKKGLSVTYIPVDESGHVNAKEVKEALRDETVLVSIMYANNEIGTVQPIREIAKIIRAWKKQHGREYPYLHTDACQATNYLDMNALSLGVDILTINGSKIYGPKGVGALYVKKGTKITPMIYGGGQEGGLRSGTENVSGVIGLAEACKMVKEMKEKEVERLTELRPYFIAKLGEKFPNMVSNGGGETLPNIINISFPHFDDDELVLRLDAKGIAVSAKSACKSSGENVSYVVRALGNGHYPESALRFSLGRHTSKKDIDYTIKKLEEIFITIKKYA